MDHALLEIGLPVKCRTCGKRGFVKPGTDHDGWWRIKLLGKSKWYCPDDAPKGQAMHQSIEDRYRTPEPVAESPSVEEELYKLLD
ncbi:MAG TPA: hypothetical protein VD907_07085 [Verrucomicrobiae bacterium]|nr:hypothetical protein [Verrucomicrobiae bacterium]